ncbi:hypothetical protein TPHA_0A03680 [Tetrapisispora phaffii CBS 4417]|uniref:Translation initiation factor beta propellor-like domain-containing protein n=1 Tax=Tetrapisispora phaffii (strain ATCC 24235 / CBS 4417 / NBRC 1672 / NRRL Y-8282 / UCD 70-5) TaxID=1071381 RepID=G8BNG6_TETPH|nr:hypothetical protein TPHA_0A03680 [Tetrapisispora phaffii CBS 4417]CCE61444.1 hypothetical protein TPHA_0A03680 [Tetrapisispora phaffii CBS 4417]
MSITSEELNYLIWRYCQEAGHEVSALALQEETRVLEFDEKYKNTVPLGTLVNLVQKGILYSESELLVKYNGEVAPIDETHYKEDFNLVQALQIDKEKYPDLVSNGKFILEHDSEYVKSQAGSICSNTETTANENADKSKHENNIESDKILMESSKNENINKADNFIKTLKEVQELDVISLSSWNPVESAMLAYGDNNSVAKLIKYAVDKDTSEWRVENTYELRHPSALAVSSTSTSNKISALAWSPNGESIITGVQNGELRIWSKDGRLQNVLNFHRSAIVTVKWNTLGNYFISSDVDNVTILWNSQTGTAMQHLDLKESSSSSHSLGVDLEWVDDSRFVIPGLDNTIVVFHAFEKKPLGKLQGHQSAISVLEMNKKSRLLLSASDDHTLRVWLGGSSNSSNCFYGHSQSIVSGSWIDEKYIISSSMDGSTRIWSRKNNALVGLSIADDIPIFAGQLSHDKTKYAVGFMDGQIIIYDIKSAINTLNKNLESRDEMNRNNNSNLGPIAIPIYGNYQCRKEGKCIFDISWNIESNAISVAYSSSNGIIIAL